MKDLRGAAKIYLNPGELVVAEAPALVTTVLGSCVSVTLFSPAISYGAICHAVLPSGSEVDPGKYVDQAVRYMMDFFGQQSIGPDRLVAKLFGGADMFDQLEPNSCSIGAQNIRAAHAILKEMGLEPAVTQVGGRQGRKLIFVTHTGEVYLKRICKEHLPSDELRLTKALGAASGKHERHRF